MFYDTHIFLLLIELTVLIIAFDAPIHLDIVHPSLPHLLQSFIRTGFSSVPNPQEKMRDRLLDPFRSVKLFPFSLKGTW